MKSLIVEHKNVVNNNLYKKMLSLALLFCIAFTAFSQSAPVSLDIIAKDTKVVITDINKKDFYYDNRTDFLNKKGTVIEELVIDKNGFYKGSIDCDNGKSYNFTKIKIEILKDKASSSSPGFDNFYESLFKDDKDSVNIKPDKIIADGGKPASTAINNFNGKLYEEQIIALISDPKDCFKNAIVPKEDKSSPHYNSIKYESDFPLEGVGKAKVVWYTDKQITYYAESSSYLSKDAANIIVENLLKQMKVSKFPFTYSLSEPYNVATRRLNSFTFSGKGEQGYIDLSLDIDMTTTDNSNTSWQVVVRINKKCYGSQ